MLRLFRIGITTLGMMVWMHTPGPGQLHPGAVWLLRRVVRPLVRLAFRPTLLGTENLPEGRPFLLVANHSAGMGVAELLCFAALYVEQVGPERPIAGFAHVVGFKMRVTRRVHRLIGTVPSSYEGADAALEKGVPLLVFPGGDHESLQPIWLAGQVDFAGRLGFLKIARKWGVPIVPMGISGGAYTAPILYRARWLASALLWPRGMGIRRWGISLLGLLGVAAVCAAPLSLPVRVGLAWACLAMPITFLPWLPATIRMRIGPPVEADDLFAEPLEAALARVEAAVQAQV